jgi:hypothetical protein
MKLTKSWILSSRQQDPRVEIMLKRGGNPRKQLKMEGVKPGIRRV